MVERISIDGCPRIDSLMLHRRGALVDGARSRWQWPMLPPLKTITVTASTKGHQLYLSVDDGPEVAYSIIRRMGTTGSAYAFLGCNCGRSTPYPSTRYLYVRDGRVGCRSCLELEWSCRIMPRDKFNPILRRLSLARAKVAALEMEALRLRRKHALKSVREVP